MRVVVPALLLAGMARASVFYLLSDDYANALGSDKNAQCTTKETVDGTSCTATYTGDNAGWNGQGLVGTFTSHDKGTFLLNGGTIEGPALGAVDVTQDTRCEPWKCTSAGFGFTSSAGGFRCVFDY